MKEGETKKDRIYNCLTSFISLAPELYLVRSRHASTVLGHKLCVYAGKSTVRASYLIRMLDLQAFSSKKKIVTWNLIDCQWTFFFAPEYIVLTSDWYFIICAEFTHATKLTISTQKLTVLLSVPSSLDWERHTWLNHTIVNCGSQLITVVRLNCRPQFVMINKHDSAIYFVEQAIRTEEKLQPWLGSDRDQELFWAVESKST